MASFQPQQRLRRLSAIPVHQCIGKLYLLHHLEPGRVLHSRQSICWDSHRNVSKSNADKAFILPDSIVRGECWSIPSSLFLKNVKLAESMKHKMPKGIPPQVFLPPGGYAMT